MVAPIAPADHQDAAAISANAAPLPPPYDGMRRLQIGMAGVIMVLLLVGLAGVASEKARSSAASAVDAGQEIVPPIINNSAPLEELGVQPVAKDAKSALPNGSSALLPPEVTVAPRASVPDLEPDPELARARQAKN